MSDLMDNWAQRYTERFAVLMVITAVVLALACGVYAWLQKGRREQQQAGLKRRTTLGGIATLALFPLLMVASVVVMSLFLLVQSLALLLLTMLSSRLRWSVRKFSTVAAIVVVAIVCAAGGRGVIRAEQAREEYPFESLVERLQPSSEVAAAVAKLTESGESALLRTETELGRSFRRGGYRGYNRRRASLEMVHATQVLNFISSEGFGFGRMFGPEIAGARIEDLRSTPQPVALRPGDADSTGERSDLWLPLQTGADRRRPLTRMHEMLSLEFANPRTYGWVRDLEHVTGFRPHGVDRYELPSTKRQVETGDDGSGWKLERIELVSLLKSAEPGVYISENLPRMDELAAAGRRPLDVFETTALRELQNGGSLVIRSQGGRVKMMGALRAARQCSLCHEVPRGTLLGAFSYCFRDQTSASSSE